MNFKAVQLPLPQSLNLKPSTECLSLAEKLSAILEPVSSEEFEQRVDKIMNQLIEISNKWGVNHTPPKKANLQEEGKCKISDDYFYIKRLKSETPTLQLLQASIQAYGSALCDLKFQGHHLSQIEIYMFVYKSLYTMLRLLNELNIGGDTHE